MLYTKFEAKQIKRPKQKIIIKEQSDVDEEDLAEFDPTKGKTFMEILQIGLREKLENMQRLLDYRIDVQKVTSQIWTPAPREG